jgi:spore germination cell wall hydrolase CwlJ-like protein
MLAKILGGLCLIIVASSAFAADFIDDGGVYKLDEEVAANMLYIENPVPQYLNDMQPLAPVDERHLACLADNIYHESRGEPVQGQIAVARVVMNRVASGLFPNDPCSVVYQSLAVKYNGVMVRVCQFSWFCQRVGAVDRASAQYKRARQIAYDVLAHNAYADLVPKTVLFFHAAWMNPGWGYRTFSRIGNHVFYHGRVR